MSYRKILRPKTLAEIEAGLTRLSENEKLRQCAANNFRRGVQEALLGKADINYGLGKKDTPLDRATMAGHFEMSIYLVEHGAWVYDTSLAYAIENRNLFILMLNNLHPELCTCHDLSETIQVAAENGRLDLLVLIEDKISEAGLLMPADRAYLQRMMLMADDITIL
jgi:hypothetical protein